jgi:hypothetical protein
VHRDAHEQKLLSAIRNSKHVKFEDYEFGETQRGEAEREGELPRRIASYVPPSFVGRA